jgi:hypothetical protein
MPHNTLVSQRFLNTPQMGKVSQRLNSKGNKTKFQMFLAMTIKKLCIVYLELHKQHLTLPCHFLLARLSFGRMTPFHKYHKKILIFGGILSFQKVQFEGIHCCFMMAE